MATPPTFLGKGASAFNTTTSPKSTSAFADVQAGDILVSAIADENKEATDNYAWDDDSGAGTWTEGPASGVTNADVFIQPAWGSMSSLFTGAAIVGTRVGGAGSWGVAGAHFRNSDGIGLITSGPAAGAAPSFSVTTQYDNSALFVMLADWTAGSGGSRQYKPINGETPVAGGATEVWYSQSAGLYSVYSVVYQDVGAAGAKTIGLNTPASGDFLYAVIEVRGSVGGVAPTANAGADQTIVGTGAVVTLDGSASTDPDGTIASYTWAQLSGTAVTLSGSGASRTFTPAAAGEYVFGLTVTDNLGATSTQDTITVVVVPEGASNQSAMRAMTGWF